MSGPDAPAALRCARPELPPADIVLPVMLHPLAGGQ